jgi:hypothetical protein
MYSPAAGKVNRHLFSAGRFRLKNPHMNGNMKDLMEEERTPTGSFPCGGVAERFKAPVLKTGDHFVVREFESRPLRHN